MEISSIERVSRSCLKKKTGIMGFSCLIQLYSRSGTAAVLVESLPRHLGGGRLAKAPQASSAVRTKALWFLRCLFFKYTYCILIIR
jgi:hypothetical protein